MISSLLFQIPKKSYDNRCIAISFLSLALLLQKFPAANLSILEYLEEHEPSGESGPEPEPQNAQPSKPAARFTYAMNPQHSVRLALAEQRIYTKLLVISMFDRRGEIPDNDLCFKGLKNYLMDYEHDSRNLGEVTGFQRAKLVTENPLLLYRMLRRLYGLLQTDMIMFSCNTQTEEHYKILAAVQSALDATNLDMPVELDLNDALEGMLRIQFIYGLNATSDLRIGILQGVHTNVTLFVEDCVVLGVWAIKRKARVLAYQWFQAASLNLKENLTLENQRESKLKIEAGLFEFFKMIGVKTLEEAHDKMRDKRQQTLQEVAGYHYNYYATCRGETTLPDEVIQHLMCYLGGSTIHPYYTLMPVKLEQLYLDPLVWLFHDFVSNRTMDYIKMKGLLKERSGVVDQEGTTTDTTYRTSVQHWIYDDHLSYPDQEMITLNRRIEHLLDLEVYKRGASQALQVVEYSSLGGHYDFHGDSLQANPEHTYVDGDRILTFFMFLSEVELGGYTAFPEMKIFVKPKRGSAILWPNVYRNGLGDDRTMHAGCPIVKGWKLVANKWIMQFENMFKHPCKLQSYL